MFHSQKVVEKLILQYINPKFIHDSFDVLRGKYPCKVIRVGAKDNLVLVLSHDTMNIFFGYNRELYVGLLSRAR